MSMALSIVPAVSGTTRKWAAHVGVFFVGAVMGALGAVMVVLAIFASLTLAVPREVVACAAAGVGACAVARDLGFNVPVPYLNRQVPEYWRREFPMAVASFGYGLVLGAGFPTLFTASTQLTVLLGAPFLHRLSVIFGVVGLFALGKTMVLGLGLGTRSEAEVFARIEASEPTSTARRFARRLTTASLSLLILLAVLRSAGVF
jgi:hypothetical protein